MAGSKSSKSWLKEHFDDEYVKRAQKEGVRSRAVYKLEEIQQRDKLLKPGMTVVDLGAAPGGWSVYARDLVGEQGLVVGLDLLPIDSIAGVEFIQGDFKDQQVYDELIKILANRKVDLVMSDMAPNMSGNKGVDIPRAMYLCELVFDFAKQVLRKDGTMLMKFFHGEGFEALLQDVKPSFDKVCTRKPKASRSRSREAYLLAKSYKV